KNMAAVKHMVNRFPHSILEAEDVIQEGITRLMMNVREGKFSGKSSVHTYLYSICRNICLKENERLMRDKRTVEEDYYARNPLGIEVSGNETAEEEAYFDQIKLVMEAKKQIGEKCIEIIDARFGLRDTGYSPSLSGEGAGGRGRFGIRDTESEIRNAKREMQNRLIPFEEIAERLEISPENARQRFKRCLDKLIRIVRHSQDQMT
ncbi:MAG: sigma-70 family RNA polymerase sigma factor, partial [Nitrospirota bacterium]